jgi:beta-galactosidase
MIPAPGRLWYGGDYNPEQWKRTPEVWEEDRRLMAKARMNWVTLGVFAWSEIEPEEGWWDFVWMDEQFEKLAANGQRVLLATPSGAKPHWLSARYEEVRRVTPEGRREPAGWRHNHCPTSDIYRAKVFAINTQLAKRYGHHPALVGWHISNEFNGFCYCDQCRRAFQKWLEARYESLDALNEAWWTRFWSHKFTAWSQVEPTDTSLTAMRLDWHRFTTDQVASFIRNERAPLKEHAPGLPVTTNFMGTHPDYDYRVLARELDFVCWDTYPCWHGEAQGEVATAQQTAFVHDIQRAMKGGQPWILMESTPSQVNWQPVSPLKRPGVLRLSGLQAVAHGADGVGYFQWRAGRGGFEKFHGAVLDHSGSDQTRVFREASELGETLEKIAAVAGGRTEARVALIFDWDIAWAFEAEMSPINAAKEYLRTCQEHYAPFWRRGIAVDVVGSDDDWEGYRLVVAPMLHMVSQATAERLRAFVEKGGTLVTTYLTGYVDSQELCWRGGFPGPLRSLLGIWAEELDALPSFRQVPVTICPNSPLGGLSGDYLARDVCELVHAEGATVVAQYAGEFYQGRPALTRNVVGRGTAWHQAARLDAKFADDFLGSLVAELGLHNDLKQILPEGVTVISRENENGKFLFLLNFTPETRLVPMGEVVGLDMESGEEIATSCELTPWGARVLRLVS